MVIGYSKEIDNIFSFLNLCLEDHAYSLQIMNNLNLVKEKTEKHLKLIEEKQNIVINQEVTENDIYDFIVVELENQIKYEESNNLRHKSLAQPLSFLWLIVAFLVIPEIRIGKQLGVPDITLILITITLILVPVYNFYMDKSAILIIDGLRECTSILKKRAKIEQEQNLS